MLLCLVLSGCFFLPGKFAAQLDLRHDGTFSYRYAGELAFAFPDQLPAQKWEPAMARCLKNDMPETRACTDAEVEDQRAAFISARAMREAQAAEMAEITGYNPYDRTANEEIARRMTGYRGWKQVTYRGAGIFDVVYEVSGRLDRDLVFPVLPQAQLSYPILTLRPGTGDAVDVAAPGLSVARLRKLLVGMASQSDRDDIPLLDRAKGTFTVTTDAEVAETNGAVETGPAGRTITWSVDGARSEAPHLKLRLKQ